MDPLTFVAGLLIAIAESTLLIGLAVDLYGRQERRSCHSEPCTGGGAGPREGWTGADDPGQAG